MGFDHSRTKSQEKTVENEGWLIFLSALIDCSSWLLWVAHYSKDEDLFVLVFLGAFEWVEHRNHFKAKLTCEILSSGRDMSCPCCDLLKIVVIFVSITSYEFDGWYLVNVSPMSFLLFFFGPGIYWSCDDSFRWSIRVSPSLPKSCSVKRHSTANIPLTNINSSSHGTFAILSFGAHLFSPMAVWTQLS